MNINKKLTFVVALFLLLGLGCTSKESDVFFGTTVPKHGPKELVINNGSEPQYIDPQKATGVPDGEIIRNMFARLTQTDPRTGKMVGDLAERWDVSADGTEYTFYMRDGLKWSDGRKLDAHDAEYAFIRLLNPETAAEYASLGFDIVNGDAYHLGAVVVTGASKNAIVSKLKLDANNVKEMKYPNGFAVYKVKDKDKLLSSINDKKILGASASAELATRKHVQVKTLDDKRLWVKLTGPLPYFLALLEFSIFAPTPKHVIDMVKAKNDGDDALWVRPENIACSGAYCLTEQVFKKHKIFKKNKNYWDADKVRLDQVKVLAIESANTTLFSYRTGDIDWTGASTDVPLEYVKTLKNKEDFHNDPYLGVYYYGFNTNRKPLDNPKVRKALSLAIDRVELSNALGGGELPYADIVPDGLAGYKGIESELFNLEKAKQLLAEAGFKNGENFPKLSIMYNTLEKHKQIAQAVQQMWKKNLNIDIQLTNKEWKVYLDDMTKQNYDIVRRGWIGDFIDPYTFLELFLSTSGNNRTGWDKPEYDNLIRSANKKSDFNARLEMFRKAEKVLAKEQPFMTLYVYNKIYMKKPYVRGFWMDYQGHHMWKHMWIDERYYDGKYHKELEAKEDIPNMTITTKVAQK